MKVVINGYFGWFNLPYEIKEILENKYPELYNQFIGDGDSPSFRSNPILIDLVEKYLESDICDTCYKENLYIIEIPDGINFVIFNYDGVETIVEVGYYWPKD
jgi:hypothetical protein